MAAWQLGDRKMETSLQDNITTRSLLKGILATESIHPPVHHQTEKRNSHTPMSNLYKDNLSVSPMLNLRSQMKERVRRSLSKKTLQNSSVKRSLNSSKVKKSQNKPCYSVVDEWDTITPRTLLKKIIQNEDEASIIISQGSKAALGDHTKHEDSHKTRLSSLIDINLSLPDLQDTKHRKVFKNDRKKRRIDISQFEKELDGKMHTNAGDSFHLNVNFEDSSIENTNLQQRLNSTRASSRGRSFLDHMSISTEPQSTYKKPLLRKPNKAFLVSLGDFEQGVEDKYHLVKGSQECFVDSIVDDKSSASASKVAELNTELYAQPLLSNAHNLERSLRSISNSFSLSQKQRTTKNIEDYAEWLEADTDNIHTAVNENMETFKDVDKTRASVGKDISHSKTNQSILKSLQNEPSHNREPKQRSRISTPKEKTISVKSFSAVESSESFYTSSSTRKSEVADEGYSYLKSNDRKGDTLIEVKGDDCPQASIVPEDKNDMNTINHTIENSELNEKRNSNNFAHLESSKQEVHFKSVQYDSFATSVDDEIVRDREKVNNLQTLSPLFETPVFIRNTRFMAPPSKPDVNKKVHKVKPLKKQKEKVAFKGSFVKQTFGHFSKMRVSKEALTDVETCLEEYIDQFTGDLAAYSAHANRKTITPADLELLMKRQRLVTDTTSLNVLIERHLPLECRKLLIPCAMSGNKVFPCLPKMM